MQSCHVPKWRDTRILVHSPLTATGTRSRPSLPVQKAAELNLPWDTKTLVQWPRLVSYWNHFQLLLSFHLSYGPSLVFSLCSLPLSLQQQSFPSWSSALPSQTPQGNFLAASVHLSVQIIEHFTIRKLFRHPFFLLSSCEGHYFHFDR